MLVAQLLLYGTQMKKINFWWPKHRYLAHWWLYGTNVPNNLSLHLFIWYIDVGFFNENSSGVNLYVRHTSSSILQLLFGGFNMVVYQILAY